MRIHNKKDFISEISEFVSNNKQFCDLTFNLAVVIYAIGNLAGRVVAWIAEPQGISKKTELMGNKNLPKIDSNTTTSESAAIPNGKLKKLSNDSSGDKQLLFSEIKEQGSKYNAKSSNDPLPASNSIVVCLNEESNAIFEEVKKRWPNSSVSCDQIFCIIEGNQLIGAVFLKKHKIKGEANLKKEIVQNKVIKLDIQIEPQFQNKGYGRKLFISTCNTVVNRGDCVYLVDQSSQGIGAKLYGGDKTRELFDVFHILNGARGEYLITKKTQDLRPLQYPQINSSDRFYKFWIATESAEGLHHLNNYLTANPHEKIHVNTTMLINCNDVINLLKANPNNSYLLEYQKQFDRLNKILAE